MSLMRKIFGLLSVGLVAVALSACSGGAQKESTGEYIDSAAITTKVKTAIATADDLSALDINVETYRGTVQLSGFVDSASQKERATKVARDVEGVQDVVNNIQVKPSDRTTR